MPRNGSGVYSPPAGTLATTLTTIKSPEYNAFVNDLTSDANAARPITAGGTGSNTAAGARDNLGLTTGTFGFLYGLTLSNNATDAVNDIDIAAGTAAEQGVTSPFLMTLPSALTKRLDGSWAVGTNQGGLDTGSIANTTYHVWLIQRSDTGVVDALFSASATSPTMPANYDRKRRIGSVLRESASIVAFSQLGDEFIRSTSVLDISAANPGASAVTRTMSVPTGVKVEALLLLMLQNTSGVNDTYALLSALDKSDEIPSSNNTQVSRTFSSAAGTSIAASPVRVRTNASAQIRSKLSFSDANVGLNIRTLGWVDTRGRNS